MVLLIGLVALIWRYSNPELKREAAYLSKEPVVSFNGKEIKVNNMFQCLVGLDLKIIISNKCKDITVDEYLEDKEPVSFSAGGELTVKSNFAPRWEGPIEIPQDGESDIEESFSLSLAGESDTSILSPSDTAWKRTKTAHINTHKVQDTPNEYIGVITRKTPSGGAIYVFNFKIQ